MYNELQKQSCYRFRNLLILEFICEFVYAFIYGCSEDSMFNHT